MRLLDRQDQGQYSQMAHASHASNIAALLQESDCQKREFSALSLQRIWTTSFIFLAFSRALKP